jgi:hypothetical protein
MALNTLKKKAKPHFDKFKIHAQDIKNKLKYGLNAPLHLERIWINPQQINSFIPKEEIKRITGKNRQESSGMIIDGSEIRVMTPLEEDFRFRYSRERWKENKEWHEIGVFEYMKTETIKYVDYSQAQLEVRYETFDKLFEEIKKDGRIKTRQEINPSNFREQDGILVHIGKDGELFFGGIGFHRFSIAKVLDLQIIPACIGLVDKNSIHLLNKYRSPDHG